MTEIPDGNPSDQPLHSEFQHRSVTARVPEHVGPGSFANAAIVLSGQFEFVIDFLLRMGKPERVTARVILTLPVAEQFVQALQSTLQNYERQFGPLTPMPPHSTGPRNPQPSAPENAADSDTTDNSPTSDAQPEPPNQQADDKPPVDPLALNPLGGFSQIAGAHTPAESGSPAPPPQPPQSPSIDDLYDDLKLDDDLLSGVYANAVLIRHSASEFCFDFVTNIYPRSTVTARVFMAAPQVPALGTSLIHSCQQHRRKFG